MASWLSNLKGVWAQSLGLYRQPFSFLMRLDAPDKLCTGGPLQPVIYQQRAISNDSKSIGFVKVHSLLFASPKSRQPARHCPQLQALAGGKASPMRKNGNMCDYIRLDVCNADASLQDCKHPSAKDGNALSHRTFPHFFSTGGIFIFHRFFSTDSKALAPRAI